MQGRTGMRHRLTRRCVLLAGFGAPLAYPRHPARAQAAPPASPPSLSIADLGARPGGNGDAAPFLKAALAKLPRRGGAVLRIPPGTWRFAQAGGVAVEVTGFENLVIDGSGARLLFKGRARPFVFTDCQAPVVRGLTLDWERPPFSQAEVVSVGAAGRAAEVRIDPEFPVDGSETIGALGTYDRRTGLMARGGVDAYKIVERVTLVGPQRLGLAFTRPLPLRPGDTVVLRHELYAATAFSFARCGGLLVEDATVCSAPGMGIYADHCAGATVRRFVIASPAGSPRLMTTTADGAHFNACNGRIAVEDCSMTGMGDDCVNVHGKYAKISQRIDARTLVVAASPGSLAGPPRATPAGDGVEMLAARTLETRGEASVGAAEASGESTTLHIDRDLPPDIQAGDYVFDAETRSQASVLRCRFPGNRARGVLAHSDAVIDGCTFSGQSAEAVLLLPDSGSMEGPAAERVSVRGNEISGVLRLGGRQGGAIRIDAAPGGPGGGPGSGAASGARPSSAPVNHDIAVTGNRITDSGGAAVLARSCAGLTIADNHIERPAGPAIVLQGVRSVRIAGNTCAPAAPVTAGEPDRSQVTLAGNTGLIGP
jgi:hypothetical protein